jgi:hypothetical protein
VELGRMQCFRLGKQYCGGGAFLGELINFIIIAFAVFLVAKKVLKEKKVAKKVTGKLFLFFFLNHGRSKIHCRSLLFIHFEVLFFR